MDKQKLREEEYDLMLKLLATMKVKFKEDMVMHTDWRYLSVASEHKGYFYSLFVSRDSGNVTMRAYGQDFDMHYSCKIDELLDYSVEYDDYMGFSYLKVYAANFVFQMRVEILA